MDEEFLNTASDSDHALTYELIVQFNQDWQSLIKRIEKRFDSKPFPIVQYLLMLHTAVGDHLCRCKQMQDLLPAGTMVFSKEYGAIVTSASHHGTCIFGRAIRQNGEITNEVRIAMTSECMLRGKYLCPTNKFLKGVVSE